MKTQNDYYKDASEWIKSLPGFTIPKLQKGKSYRIVLEDRKTKQAISNYLCHNHKHENVTVFVKEGRKHVYYGDWEWSYACHNPSRNGRVPNCVAISLKWKGDKLK